MSRSLASVSARMYRKIYTMWARGGGEGEVGCTGSEPEDETEEWAMWRTEARAVFEKGEPRHISLQTNNF